MSSALAIAQSGLSAASLRLDSAAHNIANALTPGFRRQTVSQQSQPGGGVSASTALAVHPGVNLADDLVGQKAAVIEFLANLQTIKVHDRMIGSLLDTHA